MDHEHHHCELPAETIRIGNKLKITGSIFIGIFALSYLPFLAAFNESLISYLELVWWAILLGLVMGGFIDYFVPDGFIFKYLGRRKKLTILNAALAGFLLSACSHGILAISIQLYKKGASIPAVITFLLASPWANLPITILLFGFFGVKAFIFILAAIVIAIFTGFIFSLLQKLSLIEPSKDVENAETYHWDNFRNFNLSKSVKGVVRGTVNLANMVLWWIIIGFLVAAVIKTWVPHEFMMSYFGPDFIGLLLTLLVATVIEICSEGSSPIAFEIYTTIGTLGNPFVFLMAGVVTDYTEIGLLWTNIGKRTAIWLPVVTVPQVLILGYLFNIFL
jgi:uncharacterized membrane protein YraQ (UPF0718 family)